MYENETIAHVMVMNKANVGIDDHVRLSTGIFYKRNQFIDKLERNPPSAIMDSNEDTCIRIASDDNGFDYAIMSWEGNIFNIYEYHEHCINYISELNERTNGEWLVAGQIIDQYENRLFYNDPRPNSEVKLPTEWQDCFWLYPITAIVNLKKWRELGQPRWGDEGRIGEIQLVVKGKPSIECVHDNYTPLVLYPTNEEANIKVKKGWNIINASLTAGLPVYNLNDEIRRSQTHLYPENDPQAYNQFWNALFDVPKLNDQYRKVYDRVIASKLETRTNPASWRFFLKNTEEYFPLFKEESSIHWDNIDSLIAPSSGFKDFILAYHQCESVKYGTIIRDTKIQVGRPVQMIHFDIMEKCCHVKQYINKNWDGARDSLPILLEKLNNDFSSDLKPLIYHMGAMKSYEDVYTEIRRYFNTDDDLQRYWKEYQQLEHHYITADMLDVSQAKKIIDLVKGKNVYLCLSDIAGWRNNIISYGYKNLRLNLINTVNLFLARGFKGIVDYKDPGTDLQHLQSFETCVNLLLDNKLKLINAEGHEL